MNVKAGVLRVMPYRYARPAITTESVPLGIRTPIERKPFWAEFIVTFCGRERTWANIDGSVMQKCYAFGSPPLSHDGNGWGGIRTPGAFRHTRSPGVHNQPLCHPSERIFLSSAS